MALILNIETSETICSVALAKGNKLISIRESSTERSHAKLVTVFIEDIFNNQNYSLQDLNAIAVTRGPGSYTGLRIGVSTAKGLCYGLNIPLISVGTLPALANATINTGKYDNHKFCPMIDARRMEVYSAIYNSDLSIVKDVSADILTDKSYSSFLNINKIIFIGSGSAKFNEILNNKNAFFDKNIVPSAKNMIDISYKKYMNKEFEDVAYFEPYYLKNFIAIKPRNKIF